MDLAQRVEQLLSLAGQLKPTERRGCWLWEHHGMLSSERLWLQVFEGEAVKGEKASERLRQVLEDERRRCAADRAIGICPDDAVDIELTDSNLRYGRIAIVSYAQLASDVVVYFSGTETSLREEKRNWGDMVLPLLAYDQQGREVEPHDYLRKWLADPRRPSLVMTGDKWLRERCSHELAVWSAQEPALATLVDHDGYRWTLYTGLEDPLVVPHFSYEDDVPPLISIEASQRVRTLLSGREDLLAGLARQPQYDVLQLAHPGEGVLGRWLVEQLDPAQQGPLLAALQEHPDFAALADQSVNYPYLANAAKLGFGQHEMPEALYATIVDYVRRALGPPPGPYQRDSLLALEELAFMEYGAQRGDRGASRMLSHLDMTVDSWVEVEDELNGPQLTNELVRRCLAAMKVARDVWMGHDELLERHRLAEPDVRYYLHALLPEAARARLEALG